MGILTATQMCDEIRLHLGEKTVADWPNSRCQEPLNQSLLHVTSRGVYWHRELELENTGGGPLVAAQGSYDVSILGGLWTRHVVSVVVASPTDRTRRWRLRPIRERKAHEIHQKYQDAQPLWYALWNINNLELFPAPSTAYAGYILSVRRYVYPQRFDLAANPASTSTIGHDWDEAIIQGAVWRCWRQLKEHAKAEVAKAETGQLINEIKERVQCEAEDFDEMVDLYNPPVQ